MSIFMVVQNVNALIPTYTVSHKAIPSLCSSEAQTSQSFFVIPIANEENSAPSLFFNRSTTTVNEIRLTLILCRYRLRCGRHVLLDERVLHSHPGLGHLLLFYVAKIR